MKNIVLLILLAATLSAYANDNFVPFVIPADPNPDSAIAIPFKPLTERDRLEIIERDFFNADGQVRIWGVNLSFGANFPTHKDAQRVARRMAAAGVNSARFHHIDTAKWPRGIWDDSGSKLHPEALDRLDYFIDQLARHGIYTNLNLHVGKAHSRNLDIPNTDDREFRYDKMISIFTPQIIDAHKKFAKNLLSRVNKYRNIRYADDYAVAFVEITNENSLFMWSAPWALPNLPPYHEKVLQKQYNNWLKNKYPATENLKKSWLDQNIPLGNNIIKNGRFSDLPLSDLIPVEWILEQHDGCRVQAKVQKHKGRKGLLIKPLKIDDTSWHLQFNQRGFTVEKGKPYTILFKAAAPKPRSLSLNVSMAHEPWKNLGFGRVIQLESDWKICRMHFIPDQTDDNARLTFVIGDSSLPFLLEDVQLRPGVEYSLEDEFIEQGTVKVFGDSESKRRKLDRMMFLAEIEKKYFDEMKSYIKKDIGYKGLVTGTIVFGPLGLWAQNDMDYIDAHAYWQHPHFPGKPWDKSNWIVEQKAMADHPEQSTLFQLAVKRLHEKPYTVSEYNHPAPMDSQAQCVPMIASFAAADDWNGVWLYTYSHSGDQWDRDILSGFFDIDTNPAKWGFMPAGAAIFRLFGMGTTGSFGNSVLFYPFKEVEKIADLHLLHGSNMLAALDIQDASHLLRNRKRFSQTYGGYLDSWSSGVSAYITDLRWPLNESGKGFYSASSPGGWIYAGHAEQFSKQTKGIVNVNSPGNAVFTMIPFDGLSTWRHYPSLQKSSQILITACGRCENTNMKFSPDRRTVGTNWGTGPVRIEAVDAVINLPIENEKAWTCYALNPNGTINKTVPIKNKTIKIHPKYKTMWYLLQKGGK